MIDRENLKSNFHSFQSMKRINCCSMPVQKTIKMHNFHPFHSAKLLKIQSFLNLFLLLSMFHLRKKHIKTNFDEIQSVTQKFSSISSMIYVLMYSEKNSLISICKSPVLFVCCSSQVTQKVETWLRCMTKLSKHLKLS